MTSTQLLSFRQANAEDEALLASLGARSFCQAYEKIWPPDDLQAYTDRAFSPAQIRAELADPNATFLLAFAGDQAVGYAKLVRNHKPSSLTGSNAIQIGRFYLLQGFTGRGLGNQLMDQCLSVAQNEGFETVWLAVWELNPKAIAFYQRHDFQVCGTYPFTWGDQEDADLLMKRQLG